MFKKKKKHLSEREYTQSLASKDSTQRFYDQLRAHNKQFEISRFQRFADKMRQKRRKMVHNRTIKRIEGKEYL